VRLGNVEIGWTVAFVLVVYTSVVANVQLWRWYLGKSKDKFSRRIDQWAERSDFSTDDLGGFSYQRLALVSTLALYLELLMIRWISSEISIFAYFKNFVLIACFLGFGLGCYRSHWRARLLMMILPLTTLVVLTSLPWKPLRDLMSTLPVLIGATSEVNIWGVPSIPGSIFLLWPLGLALVIIVPLFGLVAFVFIPLGQLVGRYLEDAPNGILGYTVNILGSVAGVLLYTALCFLYQPPSVWMLLAGLMMVCLFWTVPKLRWLSAFAFLFCIGMLSWPPRSPSKVYWSPYQKLTLTPQETDGRITRYELKTNDNWYQRIIDLSPVFVASHPQFFADVPAEWDGYNVPYHFYPHPPSVLVLGAGTGNDAAAAVRNGAGQVVAVEIDPLILKLGEQFHFERPYESPRVRVVVDDARSYVQNTNDRFDLILFSLLDSHTTSSNYTNIRIDNYVYTLEALRATKRLLNPGGVFVIKFAVATPWIAGRLRGLLDTVFGRTPLDLESPASLYALGGSFFFTGSKLRLDQALRDPKLADFVAAHRGLTTERATLTTDDWPYFYQHEPGLPASVIMISVVLVLYCWSFMGGTRGTTGSMRWHFFFLGAAFLLLEAQIISRLALLFGTTWLVNSIAIPGLLLLIVAANVLVRFRPRVSLAFAYTGIFVAIAVAYLFPSERLFFRSFPLRVLAATTVFCLPVFFAGIVFIRSYAAERFSAKALGSNLLGALAGGLLESLSLWTGIRSLLLIAAVLYLASWIALRAQAPVEEAALPTS